MKRSVSSQLAGSYSPSSGSAAEGTITCTICQAVYTPSRSHAYLLQAPPIALESAFMSMCHFCFRCRRPSCPNCWDTVHGICGQCAQETRVPFRVETSPLEGTLLPRRSSLPSYEHPVPSSLVSVHPGRFQESFSLPIDSIRTSPERSPAKQGQSFVTSEEVFTASSPLDIDRIETRPDRSGSLDIDKVETRPERSGSLNVDNVKTRPDRTGSLDVDEFETHHKFPVRSKKQLERILTVIALVLLLLIVLLIAAAQLSVDANLFIYKTLHVDIRAELSYLWHFLRNLI